MRVWHLFLFIVFLLLIPVMIYEGEKEVDGFTVDCIGITDTEPPLPPGWSWRLSAQTLVPSIFFGAGVVGPAIVLFTDAKCPEYIPPVFEAAPTSAP